MLGIGCGGFSALIRREKRKGQRSLREKSHDLFLLAYLYMRGIRHKN